MIEETIEISENKNIVLSVSGATPRRYRNKYTSDVFEDIENILSEFVKIGKEEIPSYSIKTRENLENIIFLFAGQKIKNVKYDNIEDFLSEIDEVDVQLLGVECLKIWMKSNGTLIEDYEESESEAGDESEKKN